MTPDAAASLAGWFDSDAGRDVAARETQLLLEGVRRFHGESMLWLGPIAFNHLNLERCMIRHRIYGAFHRSATATAEASAYVGKPESLPFRTGSLDGVVLHHALDCAVDSRVAMAEVARTLRPGGRLLLAGFNPYSLWGLRQLWGRFRHDALSGARFVSPLRVLDWLAVLGLEIDEPVRYIAYRPLLRAVGTGDERVTVIRDRLAQWQIPFGGIYVILAHKRAAAYLDTPESHRTFVKPTLVPTPLPKPTVRHIAE